ncbi:beta-propeller domain-containing protein [Brevibacillus sp. B_LB10_24]|uniref:beta-propeller domain-containing protein n=1 Tax=Brevibacillus sp. B_LB10_24 TaxID=3380645 RepID=UPI0038B6C421
MKRFSFPWFLLLTGLLTVGLTSAFVLGTARPSGNLALPNLYPSTDTALAAADTLPVVGSAAKLKQLLGEMELSERYLIKRGNFDTVEIMEKSSAGAAPVAAQTESNSKADFSATNVQVAGVDEADVVKTDGAYIYLAGEQRIALVKAYPAEEMKVVSTIDYSADDFRPQELYVDGGHLVVIGQVQRQEVKRPYGQMGVKAIVYDIRNKEKPAQVREVELEGNYLSSRKIGSSLYIVTNKYLDYVPILMGGKEPSAPVYRDSAVTGGSAVIKWDDIRYFPASKEPNYLFVAGVALDKPDQPADVSAYLGSGETVYASPQNLYVVVSRYSYPGAGEKPEEIGKRGFAPSPDVDLSSTIYKFALKQGKTVYSGSGEVPGHVLNQFSLDEHAGYLRIAATSGEIWRNDERTSKNNLYVLDDKLTMTGKLEGLAPGEKIYSVRFMGSRGYVVTFKQVDPLFVIDLKDPKKPSVLGALKIPGYSDYLHPYDENHIIGFGKDTVVFDRKDGTERSFAPVALYQGMKMAMFDVSDVSHPVEKWKEIIGDRGTDSELLHNHKALLFSKEKNLLAFPVTVMEIPKQQKDDPAQYGRFAFQGAYVYRIDPASGFKLQAKITHLTEQDRLKSGDGWYDSLKNVERILYIDDTLYTVSKAMIQANDLNRFDTKGKLTLP